VHRATLLNTGKWRVILFKLMKYLACLIMLSLTVCHSFSASPRLDDRTWPHPIPARMADSANQDLFIMTLGNVQTPLAQGTFDPVKDTVTLNDGTVKANYYRDTLGIRFYKPLDKSIYALPPSGLCTWYYYYTRVNETEVKRNAAWIAENLKDYGAQYVQIDDGWQGSGARGSARNWDALNTNRFPSGMASLAKYIKSLGLTPGIWLAPHGQNNDDVVKRNTNVFLFRPDGTSASETWEGRFLVDPTTPESMKYLHDLFSKLTGWGYEYFKIDGQPIVVNEYNSKKEFMRNPTTDDGAQLYRKTLEPIRKAIGPNRFLLGCWGTPTEGMGIFNGSRTGGDIVLGWGGFQVALRPTLQYMFLHNIAWYSDPDVVCVRAPLTLDQAQVWATLQGLTGQALLTSDRLMDLSDERVELLRRIYPAVDIRPLDLFPTEKYKRIWDLKINHMGRKYDVVGVFNFGTERNDRIHLKWVDLGISDDKPVHVFDFWNKDYLGAWSKGMIVETAPTSCRVLTLLPDDGSIQFISSSRHITQGWVDVTSISKNAAGNVFKGTSEVIKDDPYSLRFAFPRGTNYMVKRVVARGGGRLPVKIANHQGWASVEFTSPKTREVSWEVEFAPTDRYEYPAVNPEGTLAVQRVGLDGVNVSWREQYWLNAGYQVYLNGELQGYTPMASFPLRGLHPSSNYTVSVKTVWDDAKESPRSTDTKVALAGLIPASMQLTQLEPLRSTGRWRGIELEEMASAAPISIAGKTYENGLSGFANSEIEYDVKGLFNKFTSRVGVDSGGGGPNTNGAVEFILVGDGRELWRSGQMHRTDEPKAVDVAVTGVNKLVLRSMESSAGGGAATGGDGGGGARRSRLQAAWVEPKVTK
jgi:hypothetical protein